jgi:hypothetical protein
MKERVLAKPASPPGVSADLCPAECLCACSCGGIDHVADPPGWTRSAGLPNDEAVVLPVTMFNDRPFGPAFVPQ